MSSGGPMYVPFTSRVQCVKIWALSKKPANIYVLKVKKRNTLERCEMCEICLKLKTKRSERRHWCHSGVLWLTLKIFPYKHTTWTPHWNDVETVVSTWNPRGVFVRFTPLSSVSHVNVLNKYMFVGNWPINSQCCIKLIRRCKN